VATPDTKNLDRAARRRFFVRICLFDGVLFAVLLSIAQTVSAGVTGSADGLGRVGFGALWGLVVGVGVGAMLGWGQWRSAVAARDRRLAADPTASPDPDPGVVIRRTVRVPLARSEVLNRLPDAATILPSAKVREVDDAAATVTLSVPFGMRTWGERIVLAVGDDEGGSTPVTITSRPVLRGTLVDGGRNAGIVEFLAAWLEGLDA
jgi:hypothetical protein